MIAQGSYKGFGTSCRYYAVYFDARNCIWVLIAVAQVIASLGEVEEPPIRPVTCCGCLSLGRGNTSWCAAVPASQTKQRNVVIPNGHNTQPWHELGAAAVLWAEPTLLVSYAIFRRLPAWLADIRAHTGCVTRSQFL